MADENKLNVRDNAMMELMYACGLRLSELSGLNMPDIDWQQQTIQVTVKVRSNVVCPWWLRPERR